MTEEEIVHAWLLSPEDEQLIELVELTAEYGGSENKGNGKG